MPDTHIHDWLRLEATLEVRCEIDGDNGITDAVIVCSCGQHALINLLDWTGPRLARRVFSVSLLGADPVGVFLRNMRSDYCDLTRKAAEVAALAATAEGAAAVLAADTPELRVLAVEQTAVRRPFWREDLGAAGETGWPARLGVTEA